MIFIKQLDGQYFRNTYKMRKDKNKRYYAEEKTGGQ